METEANVHLMFVKIKTDQLQKHGNYLYVAAILITTYVSNWHSKIRKHYF